MLWRAAVNIVALLSDTGLSRAIKTCPSNCMRIITLFVAKQNLVTRLRNILLKHFVQSLAKQAAQIQMRLFPAKLTSPVRTWQKYAKAIEFRYLVIYKIYLTVRAIEKNKRTSVQPSRAAYLWPVT